MCIDSFSCQGVSANSNDYYNQTAPPMNNVLHAEANTTSALIWPHPHTGSKNGGQPQEDPTPYCVPLPSKVGRVNLP